MWRPGGNQRYRGQARPEVQRPEARGQVMDRWRPDGGPKARETKGNRQMRPKNPPKNQIKFQKKK
jgi:hypothetical protein